MYPYHLDESWNHFVTNHCFSLSFNIGTISGSLSIQNQLRLNEIVVGAFMAINHSRQLSAVSAISLKHLYRHFFLFLHSDSSSLTWRSTAALLSLAVLIDDHG